MTYRDDLEVVQARIARTEQQIADLKAERDRLDAAQNLGPEAPQRFSKLMYRFGRAVGRLLSPGLDAADPCTTDAAREQLRILERRAGVLEEEVALADQKAKEAALEAQNRSDP